MRGAGKLIALGAIGAFAYAAQPSDAERAEKRRAGLHCVSGWSGEQTDLASRVKGQLRDPNSYEHIRTLVFPANSAGVHRVLMQFRARNGFGGMVEGSARAEVANADCKLVSWVID